MLKKLFSVCIAWVLLYGVGYARELILSKEILPDEYIAERDQYGNFIAEETSRFYSMGPDECSGPAYRCRGIMVSAFESDNDYWMQSYPALSKISLSYWTKRTTGKTRYNNAAWLGTGFMLWPSEVADRLSGGHVFEPEYTCVFAAEALTGEHLHNGCGGYGGHSWPKCQALGIENLRQYTDQFGHVRLNACGFALGITPESDRRAFDNALSLQLSEVSIYGGTFYNEVLTKGWRDDSPEKIPLLGFFYIQGRNRLQPHGYLGIVQNNQMAFYKKTDIFVPVIRVTGTDWEHVRFEYRIADQSADIPEKVRVNADMSIN
ncbi:hypothetical protein QOM18_25450 [Serratia marcescens]|uniref:hypothetical protein n=1 Tax=Serratia marcescens TaxID=615 RepID=UPI0024C4BD37|nr:hypothetical protein [Serratia marcescens]MDK1711669.1 hypothetical protein [Serratia marcescens]